MTSTERLIAELEGVGVRLWHDAGRLRYRAPKGVMTEARLASLREHKTALLDTLTRTAGPALPRHPEHHTEPFPLTDVQAAYLLGRSEAFDYGGVACHGYLELSVPDLDADRLDAAWRKLVRRHDMLRAIVHPDGFQHVLTDVPHRPIPVSDLRGAPPERLREIREELAHRVYRTDQWPLHELRVTRTDEHDILHFSIDLLIADYLSIQRLLTELDQLYREPAHELPALDLTFRDYLLGERALRAPGTERASRYERDRDYWWNRLDDLPPAPELPLAKDVLTDTAVREPDPPRFGRHQATLSPRRWADLHRHATAQGVTASTAVLAAYAEIIGRWSRNPGFTLNLTLLGRESLHPQTDLLVGDFTSLSLLDVHHGGGTFAERARALGDQLLDDLDHRSFSGVEVLRELGRRRGRAQALMPVVYTSTIGLGARHDEEVLTATPIGGLSQTPQVWLDCQAMEWQGSLRLTWDVRLGVFPDGLIEDAFAAFTTLLERLADGWDWDSASPVRIPDTQQRRRAAINASTTAVPDGLLHEAFVERALAEPDRYAVITPERTLTYGELLAEATAVARQLESGDLVAVVMSKGVEQVVAVLAAMLAGAAYLPIDSETPSKRRDAMLADAGVRRVLTQSSVVATWPDGVRAIEVDQVSAETATEKPPRRAHPDDRAYVIFTSGSTGKPKGVVMSHRAALNTITDINERFELTPADRVLGLANLGFDLSVYDIFGPLSAGGALVLPRPDRRGDPSHWAELISLHGVTIWNTVPAQLQMLEHYLATAPGVDLFMLRLALLSGDWIPVALPDTIRKRLPLLQIVALGGATEAGIWSNFHPVGEVPEGWHSIPYGRPLTNQSLHILDASLRPAPDWVAGELYIGGAGLALGYLGDDELTAARFVVHPETGERLYRTGDFGRHLGNGDIEFLGRTDTQVKIRGHRVELAEIEAALTTHPAIASAVALADGKDSLTRRISAFARPATRPARHDPLTVPDTTAAPEKIRGAVADVGTAADRVALAAMAVTLGEAGVPEGHTAVEIAATVGATPRHHRLIRRWLKALGAAGMVREHDGTFADLVALTREDLAARLSELEQAQRRHDFGGELVHYLRGCTQRMPELLRDELDPVELLFPGTKLDTAQAAFRDNPVNERLNAILVEHVVEIARRRGAQPLRVLEIGAGVAGTSSALIPALAEFEVDYLFTDVSQFFLSEARTAFAEHSWVHYGLFDLNAEPRAQGLAPNSFDLVVAGNALHLAKDAPAALRTLRELLAPGGWLAFIEGTGENLPLMVSMEFTEELSGFTDLRQGSDQTLLTAGQWRDLLTGVDAHLAVNTRAVEAGGSLAAQHVFVAQLKTDRAPVTVTEARAHLAARLPDHMIPAHLELIDELPLNPNGKIDRARLLSWLPHRQHEQEQTSGGDPIDDLERLLVALWGEVLGHPHLGRDDDFFAVGGDSLLLARLVGQMLEKEPQAAGIDFGLLLGQLLRRPTVAALATYLRTATPEVTTAEASPLVELTPGALATTDAAAVVLVHEGTGTLAPYRALIDSLSAADLRLIGIESRDTERYADLAPDELIERQAEDYARRLLDAGIDRVRLVGYCLGGFLATEIARVLSEAGARVEDLTVVSSYRVPYEVRDDLVAEYAFARILGADLGALGFPEDEAAFGAALRAVVADGTLPEGGLARLGGQHAGIAAQFAGLGERPQEERLAALATATAFDLGYLSTMYRGFRRNLRAITGFQAAPYAGDLTLLRDSGEVQLLPAVTEDMTRYWTEVSIGDVRVVDIPGDHFSCLSPDHAPGLRDELLRQWNRGQG